MAHSALDTSDTSDSSGDSSPSTAREPARSWKERARNALLGLALLAALAVFLDVVHRSYPIENWLFWRYLTAASLAGIWAAGCAAAGACVLAWMRITSARPSDTLVLAFPVGVLVFQLAMFVLGLAGALGTFTFVALPLAFLLVGAYPLRRALVGLRDAVTIRSASELAVVVFGLGGIALLYFQLLTPEAFSWDARWYHLPLAQQYALQGSVRAFPEGWWLSSYPHSASIVFAWAFLLPAGELFDKLELCAHIELAVFLGTIASIPTLVRALDPQASGRRTWVAIFLFPGIFLYDSNLHVGADHMAAVWCIPLALTFLRAWRSWSVRDAVLFGAITGAVIFAKYSAWSMLLFPSAAFLLRGAWLGIRRLRGSDKRVLPALLSCGAMVFLISAPFWLKNWIYYGDPLYPVFYRHLNVHPWTPESPGSFKIFCSFQSPPAAGWQGFKDALLSVITFSFKPNDWWSNHRDVPVFGSLFTLSLLCLPFVRAQARLWLAYVAAMMAVVVWYMSNHQDRLLQAWLPFMAAATVATLGLVWRRRSIVVRGALALLVAAQVIWGGDVPFFPTHNLLGDSPLRAVPNLMASGFLKKDHRLRVYGALSELHAELPPEARVLLHELNLQIGIGRVVVNDQWQGRISYEALQSPAAIYAELHSLGISHMIWTTGRASEWNSVASTLAFLGFALNYGQLPRTVGEFTVANFPPAAPTKAWNSRVAIWTCGVPFKSGMYDLGSLVAPDTGRPPAHSIAPIGDVADTIASAGALVIEPSCGPALPPTVENDFHQPYNWGRLRLYVRKLAN